MDSPRSLFFARHVPKNILLLFLSLISLPITALLIFYSVLFGPSSKNGTSKTPRVDGYPRKTILVTGVSMTKGLTITRLLAQHTSHHIIAADTELLYFTSPGRYSRSIAKFHRLDSPQNGNPVPYIKSLLQVLKSERVDLWISCSSVIGAVEDGQVMKTAQKTLGDTFKVIQFDDEAVAKLHEKDALTDYIRSLGLVVPESHRCTSVPQVENILHDTSKQNEISNDSKRFILKPIGVDDKARAQMMTLLPFAQDQELDTASYLSSLNISPSNPFILQQFITGPEYCTHSLVIQGKVKAFVSCPSSDMLMHYEALPEDSVLNQTMLEFTQKVAENEGESFSGHLSFDFIAEGEGTDLKIYPIECNPRAHTAVVLFRETEKMADAYLSCFDLSASTQSVIVPKKPTYGFYWIGHDVVTLLLVPLLALLCGKGKFEDATKNAKTFWHHLTCWKDGTFEIWDPWPFFVLYHVYWPVRFCDSLVKGQSWSRINVSTTKMFES
ncbi:hypothetical protein MYU51_013625 [Penicillium brevicompactum]|uniref:uncharacterized protein n=1 Tax=Penicillium brevicompactum TaxID=5074 RepID=UPI00253F9776|nr:uncharacterized protein N7506_011921 [Penicillium brevicompactum]KAJ5319217.1 hypothetical protein N7506_011921 [Penicillium brevicompactum]